VARVICRVLPYAVAEGPRNMAADEALLAAAAGGNPGLRFYGWSLPTLSLGYFQPSALRRQDPALAALPYVRRPSGGMTLVHHHELTYALALPPALAAPPGRPWLVRVHQLLAEVLAGQGVPVRLHTPSPGDDSPSPLCFHHFTAGDLTLAGAKVVGSAQRKTRGALLQHGGILLARSPFTPTLPGVRDLAGVTLDPTSLSRAVIAALGAATGWDMTDGQWQLDELHAMNAAALGKFTRPEWNDRR